MRCRLRCNQTGEAVYLDFSSAITKIWKRTSLLKGEDENDHQLMKKMGQEIVKSKVWQLISDV
jgi:succinate dehydrogenase / fumarate reductase flavoprotein subunit